MQTGKSVALIAHGPEAEFFEQHLVRSGLEVSTFAAIADFREGCGGRSFSGVAVELGCLAALPDEHREFVAELERSFPVLRLRRVRGPDEVGGVFQGKALAGEALLASFVAEVHACRPRGVRLQDRRDRVLSALVFADERELGGPGCRASIANLSKTGFYVVTPVPAPRGRCLLVVPGLSDATPIPCEVRWSMPWGASTQVLPGFGVRCLALTARQREALAELLATDG